MTVEQTLVKVEADLAAGDVPMARQRLQGLVGSFPQRLDLRERPAELLEQARAHTGDVALTYPGLRGRDWSPKESGGLDDVAGMTAVLTVLGLFCLGVLDGARVLLSWLVGLL
ncbi:MAG TPA: DUF6584 family protein [Kineosporiaceae bacterium]|nr:DUF6584 family protein [Kineosporiaceae bacterium]